jgi:hypothetical protein
MNLLLRSATRCGKHARVKQSCVSFPLQMWQSFHAQIPVDEEAEREKLEKEKIPLDECIR